MSDSIDLVTRVAALERQNTQLRRCVAATVVGLLALPLLGAVARSTPAVADEVKATRFVVVDPKGVERAVLEFAGETTSRLVFRGPEGEERLLLGADPRTAFVIMKDEREKNRLGLAVDAYPHLMMHDETQQPRVHLAVGVHGAASMLFSDGKSFPLGLGVGEDGKIWRKPEIDREMEAAAREGKQQPAPERPLVVPPAEAGEGKKRGG